MKKLLTVLVIALCCMALVACQAEETPQVESSIPTSSQDTQQQVQKVTCLPAHDLQNFTEIVGWYVYEYSGNSRYPNRVVRTDMDGNTEESYELIFDEDGVPDGMILRNLKGDVSPYRVSLFCDSQGNVRDVCIFDEEDNKVTQYLLTYDENNRMVNVRKIKQSLTLTLDYDENHHLNHAVWRSGSTTVEIELAYDKDHRLTKRLLLDEFGAASGMEAVYDDAGILREYYWYEADALVRERYYNERGQLDCELYRSVDGLRESKVVQEYDQEGRVAKVTLEENGELVSWTELSYQDLQYSSVTYDAQGNITGRDYTNTDENGRVVKKVVYGDHDNVLEDQEYDYNAQGAIVREKHYTYTVEGALTRGTEEICDDQGRRLSYWVYTSSGLLQGYERVQDEAGNIIEEREYQTDGGYTVKTYIPGTRLCINETAYGADGGMISSIECAYEGESLRYMIQRHENGSVVETYYNEKQRDTLRIDYDADGVEVSRGEWTYHENNRVATSREYVSGKLINFLRYNENGERVQEIRYDQNGEVISTRTWEYIYYESGKIHKSVCTIVGKENGFTEIVYYENGRKQSVAYYDENGILLDITYYNINGFEIQLSPSA